MSRSIALTITKNTAALLIGRIFAMVLSFAFVVYAARILGVDGFGKYAIAQGYFELFLRLSATGLTILIIREVAKKPSRASLYLNTSIVMVTVLSLLAGIILVTIVRISGYAPDTRAAIYLVCLALLPAAIGLVFEAEIVAFEKVEFVTYATVLESVLRLGLSFIVLFLGYGLLALFVILILSRICMLFFYFVVLNRHVTKLHWYLDFEFIKHFIRDWRVFAGENWLSNLFGSLDVIVLSFFVGEAAVGLYAAAFKTLRLGIVVARSYITAIFPYMSRLFEESRNAFQRLNEGSLKYMMALVLPVVVTIAILADRIILMLYGDEFAGSIPILRVLVWVLVLQFLNPFLSHVLFARGEQSKSLQVAAISLSFYVIISLLLTSRWGGIGTAWALLLAMIVAFCIYLMVVLSGEGIKRTLWIFGRTVFAGFSLSAFLLLFRNVQPILLLVSAGFVYFLLLFIFRVAELGDLDLFRRV